ncbi:hypothetical protein [Enterovibrio nigricans]|uniref:Uncharacterized protein n=1 Tax=Enterovibrio nigricans DSM 22720 TaxID=1121868 RepID=A0A1T4VC31_9GAMM|nr:hypothetical protein [Enterovibrio nigricans]PKF49979.1 hypothetical protein AT251_14945 [Enterovibrio nigricans]SKA62490.1 hypothetical protein SAMN02745132_03631 [Enterovibrio nigricans DSM 22720]
MLEKGKHVVEHAIALSRARFQGEINMADKENYRVAIDILCCHLGMSFDEACAELGLADDENRKLKQVSEMQQSLMGLLPEDSK